jgi:hypothetical protein
VKCPPFPTPWHLPHVYHRHTTQTVCRYRGCTTAHAAELECSLPWPPSIRPPIMASITPSPDVSPVSAATTNGQFPRDSVCLNLSTLPDAGNFILKSALRSPHLLESPNGLFSGDSSNPFRKRPRNMSQSSGTDREMSSELTPPAQSNGTAPTSNGTNGSNTEPRPSSKKRPSTDTIDYPRRRATIAVL